MKVKVIEMFRDKYNNKIVHKANDVLEVSKKRYEETKQFVEIIEKNSEEIVKKSNRRG